MAQNNTISKNPSKINQKNIYITYVIIAGIAWFPLSSLMYSVFDLFGKWLPNYKLLGVVDISNLVALLFSGLIFLAFAKSVSVYNFTNDVFAELSKVSWPIKIGTGVTRWEKYRELRESTMVVLIGLAAMAVVVGIIDFIFQILIKLIF